MKKGVIMRCPYCKKETRVVDSREASDNSFRRRRECSSCGKRFTTYERIETTNLLVIKKDGMREPFSREKVRLGMIRACEKLPISSEKIERGVLRVEQHLKDTVQGEVSSKRIGELVMKELRRIDKVAYIRFAAVYREFADLEDFEEELRKLLRKGNLRRGERTDGESKKQINKKI